MERIQADSEFSDAAALGNLLLEWLTEPQARITFLEDGAGNRLSRAVLIERSLSDGSTVLDIRLS